MYNLIEYSDNYSDTSGSLFQFEEDEQPLNIDNLDVDNSISFKYKSNLLKGLAIRDDPANTNPDIEDAYRLFLNAQIVVPLKYVSSFSRTLKLLLVNTK